MNQTVSMTSFRNNARLYFEQAKEAPVTIHRNRQVYLLITKEHYVQMVNKIQFMRKEAGFEVVDRINVYYEAGPRLRKAVERFASRIAGETLAECLTEGREAGELGREWDVNGEEAWIAVERVKKAQ